MYIAAYRLIESKISKNFTLYITVPEQSVQWFEGENKNFERPDMLLHCNKLDAAGIFSYKMLSKHRRRRIFLNVQQCVEVAWVEEE